MKMFFVLHTGHSNSFGAHVIAEDVAKLHESAISVAGGGVASIVDRSLDTPEHRMIRIRNKNQRRPCFIKFSIVGELLFAKRED